MKIKTELTFATGQYENAKPVIEIDVPDAIAKDPIQLYWYLYDMFHDIGKSRPKPAAYKPTPNWKMTKARKEGVDFDEGASSGEDALFGHSEAEIKENYQPSGRK